MTPTFKFRILAAIKMHIYSKLFLFRMDFKGNWILTTLDNSYKKQSVSLFEIVISFKYFNILFNLADTKLHLRIS